jgi:hypothetical protein
MYVFVLFGVRGGEFRQDAWALLRNKGAKLAGEGGMEILRSPSPEPGLSGMATHKEGGRISASDEAMYLKAMLDKDKHKHKHKHKHKKSKKSKKSHKV